MATETVVALNPRACRGVSRLEWQVKARLGPSAEVVRTAYPGHATEIARQAAREGCAVVVAVGGDGTVNEVVTGMIGSRMALGIVPAGTANDLARHMGLPRDAGRACEVIRAGTCRRVDVLRINDRFLLTGGGVGMACDVADMANRFRRRAGASRLQGRLLGSWTYLLGALWAVIARREHGVQVTVTSPSGTVTTEALSVTVANQPFIGGRFRLSPGAENDDGQFDVCLIHDSLDRPAVMRMMRHTLAGSHTLLPRVECWRSNHLRIELARPRPLLLDGEVAPATRELEVGILPGALDVLVPGERA